MLISSASPNPWLEPRYHRLLLSIGAGTTPLDPSLLSSYLRAGSGIADLPGGLHAAATETFRMLYRDGQSGRGGDVKPEQWAQVWSALLAFLSHIREDETWFSLWSFLTTEWTPETTPEAQKKVSNVTSEELQSYSH